MGTQEKFEAYMQLSEAKARYCRFLDSKDWEGFANLMTEDFVLDVSQGSPLPVIRGRDKAIEQIKSSLLNAKTAHQVHSPEIELDGDEAQVIWAMQDRVVWAPDRPSLVGYGHYHERWVRRGSEWKVAELRLVRLHVDMLPPTEA